MERARKSRRKVPNGDQNVDRLSALPDGVICHILSFLETHDSVQTSILAKRWRNFWAHVPVLSFNHREYSGSRNKTFPGMVCAFMLCHKVQSLITFRLMCPDDCSDDDDDDDDDDEYDNGPCNYEVQTCIAVAVVRNVQNLYLARLRVEVPRCLLTCKTLVDLTMWDDVRIPPSAPISLPNLKKLLLWFLKCDVDFTRLLSGCPVLEELIIDGTTCSDQRGCCISSTILKRLTIINLLDSSMFNNPEYMVTIYTPALRYLKVSERSYKHISISPCTSLVEADIRIDSLCEADDFYHICVLKFLGSICNVKCLKLSGYNGKICDGRMPGSIVKFDNLTKLELWANWCILTKFFESADHLQVLTIFEDSVHSDHVHSEHWMDPIEERSECLLHSLRTVRIDAFRCKEQGFNMVRYVLRNAQVLERMEISFVHSVGVDLKERFDAVRKITMFHRQSRECELDFS